MSDATTTNNATMNGFLMPDPPLGMPPESHKPVDKTSYDLASNLDACSRCNGAMATAWTGSGGDGDAHQLDLGLRVEEPADLDECHRRVVTAEMPPVGLADLLRCAQVFGDVFYEDLHADQVLRVRPGGL